MLGPTMELERLRRGCQQVSGEPYPYPYPNPNPDLNPNPNPHRNPTPDPHPAQVSSWVLQVEPITTCADMGATEGEVLVLQGDIGEI